MRRVSLAAFGGVAFIVLVTLLLSAYTVDQGERAVVLRFGRAIAVAQPGFHLKVPWMDTISTVTVRTQVRDWSGDEMVAYSRDQQPAELSMRVTYVIEPDNDSIMALYAQYGTVENYARAVIDPTMLEETKTIFGQFNAVTAVQERARLNTEIEDVVRAGVRGPGRIETVQVQNIDFSEAYEASIEQRMLAEVEVERIRQNLERERTQAEIRVVQAGATAEAVRLQGEAEAAAIRARGEALRDNPDLVSLNAVEKWDGVLPTTMPPNAAVPFLSLPTGTE